LLLLPALVFVASPLAPAREERFGIAHCIVHMSNEQSVQVSDTTKHNQSTKAGYIKFIL